jgi:hypothetical protein
MSSGYRMAAHYLPEAFPAAPRAGARAERWFFQQVDDAFDAPGPRRERLLRLLRISAKVPFKPLRVGRAAWAVAGLCAAAVGAGAVALHLHAPAAARWTAAVVGGSAALGGAAFLLGHHPKLRPAARVAGALAAPVAALGGWVVAAVYLRVFNPLYLRAGRMGMTAPPEPPAAGQPITRERDEP